MQENMFWHNWLKSRSITDSIITDFNIHWGVNDTLGECIVIPVHDEDGNFSFNKYRRNPLQDAKPKYVYDRGGKSTLFGYSKAKAEKTILITEGELDALVAWSHNIPAVSSTGGANTFKEEWAELLKDKEVLICFDNDEAGGSGMVKVLSLIPHAKILFLPDRPGIKDITDYVSSGGNLSEFLRSAKNFTSVEDVTDNKSERLSLWQSTWFHDKYIEEHTAPVYVRQELPASEKNEVLRAKNFPIHQLIKFNGDKKACCLWHKEKTPSLHYYVKTNKVYCFGGCGKGFDAIDVYRQLHNCSFKEAIKALI